MTKTHKDIGKFYKEQFADFSVTPPDNIWKQIQKQNRIKKYYRKTTFVAIGTLGIVAMLWFTIFNTEINENTTTQNTEITDNQNNTTQKTNIIVSQEDSIQQNIEIQQNKNNSKEIVNKENNTDTKTNLPIQIPTKVIVQNNSTSIQQFDNIENQINKQQENKTPIDVSDTKSTILTSPPTQTQSKTIYSKDTAICPDSPIELFVKNATNVHWSNGESTDVITLIPNHNDIISVSFTNESGIDTTIDIHITYLSCAKVFIPTAFTPNGDGLNDFFIIQSSEPLKNFEICIYNQQNQIVFQSNNQNISWDGTFRGKTQPHGMYFYRVRYEDFSGNVGLQQNEFLLIRE